MLRVYAFFHLNMMFSSIREDQRADVIARCYWPILKLAERLGRPIGIEASGYTLETIDKLDPAWIAECRALIERRLIEPIGSGYTQMIGPLNAAELVRWNLKLGHQAYERIWGCRPRLALINEQAYSAGILPHYKEAGYEAILMDWDMCAHIHFEWPDEWRYNPQCAVGEGAELTVLWTSSILFQKLQRLAHGDIGVADYVRGIIARGGSEPRTLALYANDAECFDFRPGRFQTEAAFSNVNEWAVIEEAFTRLLDVDDVDWITPAQALTANQGPAAFNRVHLESAAFPIPVKKQLKYNASRWAVTGRASFELNRRCRSAVRGLHDAGSTDEALWRRLCWLGSSDLRTHITEPRFQNGITELMRLESEIAALTPFKHAPPTPLRADLSITASPRAIDIAGPSISVRLNPRKGLAIERLSAGASVRPIIGTIPHGAFDDLVHAFDWYSGTLISDLVGRSRITDLAAVAPKISEKPGLVTLVAEFDTPVGPIRKTLTCDGRSLSCRYELDWPSNERGTIRIANLTALPDEIDPDTLFCETHNGGVAPDRFLLKDQTVDHGAPVSFLVSASSGMAMTEGVLKIGDARSSITVTADDDCDAYFALLTHRRVKGKIFCRAALSAAELDDTRNPWRGSPRPLCIGYRITAK